MKLRGSLLIESVVTVGIIGTGLVTVFLGFLNISQLNTRNTQTALALSLMQSKMNQQSMETYVAIQSGQEAVSSLPDGELSWTAVEPYAGLSLKQITLRVSWNDKQETRQIQSAYELTPQGIVRD